ncbi:MAG: cytochrome P450 [Anaerolineae bacterium]|nr:cytochrome P450 [Anaerolineae bacterium]
MTPKARFHEVALYWHNHPLQYFIGMASHYFGRVVYLPFNKTYFVNDIEIAKKILLDTENFSLAHAGGLGYLISEIMGREAPALFNMEGKKHRDLRRALLLIFQPHYLQKMVEEALAPEFQFIKEDKEVDLVRLAKRCTSRLSCHMMGMSHKHKGFETLIETVADLSDELTRMLSITQIYPTLAQKKKGEKAYQKFCSLIEEYYTSKHILKNSVMSRLKEDGLTFDEAKALLVTLIVAGTETVASAMPRIAAIMIDDLKWRFIAQNQNLLPQAISEGLRITSPAPLIVHGVKQNTTVNNKKFIAHRRVLIMLVNMLRNDSYFENAMDYNLERQYPPQYRAFWFGAGPHYCLGAQLTHHELSYIYERLFARFPNPQISARKYTRHTSFPGYSKLVIKNG